MAAWIAFWSFSVLLTTAGKLAESALVFTHKPADPTYVIEGHNASLEWDYSIDDRENELRAIIWNYVDLIKNQDVPLIFEITDGTRKPGLALPPEFKGRVSIEGRATLVIYDVRATDAGKFKCFLQAKLGSNATDQESEISLIVQVPPKVTQKKPDVKYGRVNDTITFTCNVSGDPTPNITWYRGDEVVSGSRYSIISVTPGSSQLTIKRVSYDDNDFYVCRASSSGMEPANAKCFLGVVKGLEEDNKSCTKRRYEVHKGENVSLCCPVSAQPSPEVEWTFKGEKIGRFLSTVLELFNISDANYGSYECTARDLAGTSKTFVITLNETTSTKIEDATQKEIIKRGETFKWKFALEALHFLIQYSGKDIFNDAVVGASTDQSVEIPFSTLKFKSEDKKPDPVEVTIVVWAIGKDGIIGKGGPFLKGLSNETSAGRTSEAFTFTLIILILWALNLQ